MSAVTDAALTRTGHAAPGVPAERRRAWVGWMVAAMLALLLLPFVPLVLASVADAFFYPQVLPGRWSTRAWRIVLNPDGATWAALVDTVTIGVSVAVLSLLVAVPAGRVLGTRRFRGRRLVELVLLLPVLVPAVAVALGLHVVLLRLGLAGGMPGVVLVHLVPATPYVVLLTAGVYANAELELEEQARALGASAWQARRHVTWRLIAPGLVVAGLFGFLVSWGQYVLTLVVGGGRVVTLPILLFATAWGGDGSVTAATALFHALPALLLLAVVGRVLGGDALTSTGGAR
jgi:putative spermidine/putrescine transport system permease protein